MDRTYRRNVVFSSLPVRHFYRYKDLFQILPPDEAAPKSPILMGHHPAIIEYSFDTPEMRYMASNENSNIKQPVPHWITISERASDTLKEIVSLLSVLTNYRFFTYHGYQAWFIAIRTEQERRGETRSVWGQESYTYPGFQSTIQAFSAPHCAEMLAIDPQEYYNRYGVRVDQSVDLPRSLDGAFSRYYSLDDKMRESFLCSCTLFCNGMEIWSNIKSLSFAAFISSIEGLIAYEHGGTTVERCPHCGQAKYEVTERFRDFLNKYGSPDHAFRKYATKLYRMRSKILHRGELFLGDLYFPSFGILEHFDEDQIRRSVIQTTRICLVNWLCNRSRATPMAN